jgi:NADPH-dependent FMN reductase
MQRTVLSYLSAASVPAATKNALDIASRPYGQNARNDTPGAVIRSSPGAIGGYVANHHLRVFCEDLKSEAPRCKRRKFRAAIITEIIL